MSKNIYKMFVKYGMMGDIEGMFVSTPEKVAAMIGKRLYFGEILGKHSEVEFVLRKGHIKPATSTQPSEEVIEFFEKHIGSSGFDPSDYLPCPDCGEPTYGEAYCYECDKPLP